MKGDLKARWIAALLSGKYTQGKNQLRNPMGPHTTHCCLGVLCELVDPDGWNGDSMYQGAGHKLGYGGLLNTPACKKLGLPFQLMDMLASLNDQGYDFETIADVISREVPVDEEAKT